MTRREFGALAGLGAVAALRPGPLGAAEGGLFPFGAHVYREPHRPLDELRADLAILKRLGFTLVKVQESWATDEPREGVVDLTDVSRVVADAGQLGLRVFFGVTMEQAPAWLWRKYPDANVEYETGQRHQDPTQYLLPSDGKPGPCWHHPGAREAAARFIRTLGHELASFENILVWNVWQEIGRYPWAMRPGGMWFCYCANTLAAYREWLRGRYGTLDAVNAAWRTRYAEWEEIVPPRWYRPVPASIEWRYFMDVVSVGEAARWKAAAFREADPRRRPIMAHANGPLVGSTRDWSYAKELDVYGTSSYPDWGGRYWRTLPLAFEYVRAASAGKPFWIAELQGGPIAEGLNLRRTPRPADIRRWVLTGLASGASGICFWNHRAEILWGEGFGFGLLDSVGDTTPRAEEAGRLGRAITANADLFANGAVPEPRVAILVDEDRWHFVEASGNDVRDHFADTVAGLYKALWEAGITVGFVSAEALLAAESSVAAIVLPFPVSLSAKCAATLVRFVEKGGLLVSEACPGRFDEHGIATNGEMPEALTRVFGARHASLSLLRDRGETVRRDPDDPRTLDGEEYHELTGTGELAGEAISPSYYLQTLEPTTGKAILLSDGRVAAVANDFGKGRAYLFGTLLGHAPARRDDPRTGRMLTRLLGRKGIEPDGVGRLIRRRRVRAGREAWFFFNETDAAVEEAVSLEGRARAVDLMGEPIVFTAGVALVRVEPRQVRCVLVSD